MSERSVVDAVKALLDEREQHVTAIATIDHELAAVRAALGMSEVTHRVEAVPDRVVVPFDQERPCERCGKSFLPSTGSSGRFCSRQCYGGGLDVDERRQLILERLKAGPMFAASIQHGVLDQVSRATIHNDLQFLRTKGLVENADQGWQLTAPKPVVEVASASPFETVTATTNYQTLPQSRSH